MSPRYVAAVVYVPIVSTGSWFTLCTASDIVFDGPVSPSTSVSVHAMVRVPVVMSFCAFSYVVPHSKSVYTCRRATPLSVSVPVVLLHVDVKPRSVMPSSLLTFVTSSPKAKKSFVESKLAVICIVAD